MRNIILHSHIFKNAGTTFDYTLKNNFKEDFIDHRDDVDMIDGKQKYLIQYLKKNKSIKALSSHSIHFTAKSNANFNFHQVYFIRHPIERIKSVYNFEKKQGSHTSLGAKMANELNFIDYIEWRMGEDVPATIRNCHTLFLSGEGPQANNVDNKFKAAHATLKQLVLIGVVDRYDESMVVFEEYLTQYFSNIDLSYIRQNITNKDNKKNVEEKVKEVMDTFNPNLKEIILKKNSYDMKLYEMSNNKLDEQIAKIMNFDERLKFFKQRCKDRL